LFLWLANSFNAISILDDAIADTIVVDSSNINQFCPEGTSYKIENGVCYKKKSVWSCASMPTSFATRTDPVYNIFKWVDTICAEWRIGQLFSNIQWCKVYDNIRERKCWLNQGFYREEKTIAWYTYYQSFYTWEKYIEIRNNMSCSVIPKNAIYNEASSILQKRIRNWSVPSSWYPSLSSTFNNLWSKTECRFNCIENYKRDGSNCVGKTRIVNCSWLILHSEWNTVSQITQTRDGKKFAPTNIWVYDNIWSTENCLFKCSRWYILSGSNCIKFYMEDWIRPL
jgi:hypothetical protein